MSKNTNCWKKKVKCHCRNDFEGRFGGDMEKNDYLCRGRCTDVGSSTMISFIILTYNLRS